MIHPIALFKYVSKLWGTQKIGPLNRWTMLKEGHMDKIDHKAEN